MTIFDHQCAFCDEVAVVAVAGIGDSRSLIDVKKSLCLNDDDDHPFQNALIRDARFLASEMDGQLIIHLRFLKAVRVKSLKIKAPASCGPETMRFYCNLPSTPDFGQVMAMTSVQDVQLKAKQLADGDEVTIPLKAPEFLNLQSLLIFVENNQGGEDVTQVDHMILLGLPLPYPLT